jgi:hypothetical protein
MRITEILSELEAAEDARIRGAESLSPLQRAESDYESPEVRALMAKLKRPQPTKIARQMLASDPNVRPLLKNLSIGYAEEM